MASLCEHSRETYVFYNMAFLGKQIINNYLRKTQYHELIIFIESENSEIRHFICTSTRHCAK
jgi:hypothetical protein